MLPTVQGLRNDGGEQGQKIPFLWGIHVCLLKESLQALKGHFLVQKRHFANFSEIKEHFSGNILARKWHFEASEKIHSRLKKSFFSAKKGIFLLLPKPKKLFHG